MSVDEDERLRELEQALEAALEERNRLWDERNRRLAAEAELADAKALLAAMSGSLSWRITRPLRDAKAASGEWRARARRASAALRSRA